MLRFLHFADNSRRPDPGEEYDRLWKIRTVFDALNQAYPTFYNPSEHLAVDEINVKFQGRVIFRKYIPKKRKCFGIKMPIIRSTKLYIQLQVLSTSTAASC